MRSAFDKALRRVAKPALEGHGFKFDGRRTFRRVADGKNVGIEFQLGTRFMHGRFTVNLLTGEKSARLGIVRETRWSRFVNRMFGTYDPWWKGILLPNDKWWKLRATEARMDATLRQVVAMIEEHGLPWLTRSATKGDRQP
jgi:hypothetical protein